MSLHDRSDRKNTPPSKLSERLFFHDIINLTHGLILFFSNKNASQKGIELHEMAAIEKEIRTLQLMLKDHYQMKHKNLDEDSVWLPLKEIRPAISGLLETYLAAKNIPYTFNCRHDPAQEHELLNMPVFYRIMNNLIKNMSEAATTHAQIDLIIENGKLLIETRNKVEPKADKNTRPAKGPAKGLESLGLESIRLLALENGGSFSHEMINNLWSNHISLPMKTAKTETKNWSHKKAA